MSVLSKVKKILPYAVGILLIVAIAYYIGFAKIGDAFSGANFWFLPFIFLLEFIEYYLQVTRAILLFREGGHDVRKGFLKNYAIGHAVAFIVPSRAAGEIARFFALSKVLKLPFKDVTAALIVERIFDIFILSIFGLLGSIYVGAYFQYAYIVGLVFAIAIIILVLLIVSDIFLNIFVKFIRLLRLNKYHIDKLAREYILAARTILENKKSFIVFIYTLLLWLVDFLRVYLLIYMFGFGDIISFIMVAGIIALSYLLAIVFILPGGLGVFEGGTVAVFVFFGIPAGVAFSVMFIERIFSFWFWIFFGFFALSKKLVSHDDIHKHLKKELKK